jgi:hypothetical protein
VAEVRRMMIRMPSELKEELKKTTQKQLTELMLMAHACAGGRDQEDHGSKPVWANSSRDPILKKHITKKDCWSGSRYRP